MTEPPEIIHELVERFERNIQAYKSQDYKEEQLKQEFLNPFFEALGWDVNNKSGAAPQHRDVIFEDSIKVAGGTTAPDYCFTLSGKRMFFLEAKKPSVNIKRDIHPAYQLRRYAWSAKLPVSVLSDFEEFAVYESRKLPKKEDKASTERIMYLTYKDYVDKWDEISSIFSRKAVLKGSFDRFVETAKKKRGTQEV
ncbi:MAG: restriction endonuclease subunit R, partial [Thermoplasmata archaeon]|nr:restriction endonuclease subunit R [Thermoplasmata archaeon]